MRISNVRDLGLYVRDRRRDLHLTQSALAEAAQVSRRWLSDFEAGKPTAEVGLILNVLHALGLEMHADPVNQQPAADLDEILRSLTTGGAAADEGGSPHG